jgi:hypothetical protein
MVSRGAQTRIGGRRSSGRAGQTLGNRRFDAPKPGFDRHADGPCRGERAHALRDAAPGRAPKDERVT